MAIPDLAQTVNELPGMAASQSGGMFGNGKFGIAQAIVAALNGYLAGTRGPGQQVGMNNLQMMADQRQKLLEHQQALDDYYRQQQGTRSNFLFEQDYKSAHETPDIQQRIAVLNSVTPGLGDTYAKNYAQNGGGLGPMLTNPITGQQMMPAARAQSQQPPAEAVARLRANPAEAQQFDEIFGPGASANILGSGGQAATPSATFP